MALLLSDYLNTWTEAEEIHPCAKTRAQSLLVTAVRISAGPGRGLTMPRFDIAPSALPNGEPEEVRFEDPHDVEELIVDFQGEAPASVKVYYLQKTWPACRSEATAHTALEKPASYGWIKIDDPVNSRWQRAATIATRISKKTLRVTFKGLCRDGLARDVPAAYDVNFRRTLGVKVEAGKPARVSRIGVHTRSERRISKLRIELDASRRTPGREIKVSGYHARIKSLRADGDVACKGGVVTLGRGKPRAFVATVVHMEPAPHCTYDDAHLTFACDSDAFTISIQSLRDQGPIWFSHMGIFITDVNETTPFNEYRRAVRDQDTITQRVAARGEHSLHAAISGQPRPHAVPFVFGCKYCREKFWLEPDGDIVLAKWPIKATPGKHKEDFLNEEEGRFLFGLQAWLTRGRHCDSFPMLGYNIHLYRDGIELHQQAFATPLRPVSVPEHPEPDDKLVAMLRFTFRNTASTRKHARLQVQYTSAANRGFRIIGECDKISAAAGVLKSDWRGKMILRAQYDTDMRARQRDDRSLVFVKRLEPGQSCEILLKVPFSTLKTLSEERSIRALQFDECHHEEQARWNAVPPGSLLHTPHEQLNTAHLGHPSIVHMSDYGAIDGSGLVNTSVGAAIYINFANESCMILQDLDQRGLHEEARKRLMVWLKYQGSAGLRGDFTDHEGVFFGAGGLECGASYNQHHGWVMWYIAEHYFVTRDDPWLREVADPLIAGADWIIRQRDRTKTSGRYSRGWERGFLPVGALEDIDDYFFWLSTNCLTWRGLAHAARALDDIGHREAPRLLEEAGRFAEDLRRGFEISRQHSPLIRLRDGRWIPHYPSRLYRRGRDVGWIREVLEGSVYLILSGLIDPGSQEASWILDDYQDTRYMNPPFGFRVGAHAPVPPELFEELKDPDADWYCQGGFSIQPNLLGGLIPYLDRDEIEIFLWMFFNRWAACYREEIGAMAEFAIPELGFSNQAPYKTSDQANALKWLRYMFVYCLGNQLHIGRAIPRAWFGGNEPFHADDVSTRFGRVSIKYVPALERKRAEAFIDFRPFAGCAPQRFTLRFRLPKQSRLRRVTVNGKTCKTFSAETGDIELTGLSGRLHVAVTVVS